MLQADGASLENALGSEQQTAGGLPGDAGAANSSCSQLPESLPVPRYRNHHEAQQEIHPALALNPTKLFVSSSQEIEERWGLSGALPGPPARPGSSSSSSSSNSFTSLSSACSSMEFEERWGLSGALPGAPARPDSPDPRSTSWGDSYAWRLIWGHTGHAAQASSSSRSSNGSQYQQALTLDACSSTAAAAAAAADEKGKRPIGSKASQDEQKLLCTICDERHHLSNMVAAALPQQVASSSAAAGRCGHYFCKGDVMRYVRVEMQNGRYPLHCPEASCQEFLAYEDVLQLLLGQPALQALFEKLAVTGCIDPSRRAYCPYKECSCLLERPEEEDEAAAGGQDSPFECPECHKAFCLSCGIKGWHEGMTCAQFQALPPELRSAEDAAVLRMAQQHGWKRCPGCGHIVVRTEGCNHMRCHCGAHFCYECDELNERAPLLRAVQPVVLRRAARPVREGRLMPRALRELFGHGHR
uniref:RBR-type E3 ubiquitin transferase n=1 Tax=Tetradesmus obliquus TaxID=3088 RepID=A0A383WBY6_TETOB|eukprot:jgi/Sobl393_1/15267/SZX75135.1